MINFKRAQRQFGRFLTPNTERINNGIGLELKSSLDEAVKIVVPTLTFDDTLTLDIAGKNSIPGCNYMFYYPDTEGLSGFWNDVR